MISISGPKIYTEEGVLSSGTLCIAHGIITDISEKNHLDATFQFPSDYHLIPGFIDLHVHGANAADVMDGTVESLQTIANTLVKEGTTSFLATTMTSDLPQIEKSLATIAQFRAQSGAKILGVHLEGPFISAEKSGAQAAKYILPPDIALIEKWQKISNHAIKMVTFAPELKNSAELIAYLKKNHIVPALGHSNATYAEAKIAIDCGAEYTTHLLNAMRTLHQREPGLAGAALAAKNVYTEIIADGVHLHPVIIDFILKLKDKDKIILMTDAMRAKCLKDGAYDLGGQMVEVRDGIAALPDGTLAGSTLKMPTALQNILEFTDCDFVTAMKMATENPAKALGIFDRKGSIARKKDADLVVLDPDLQVVLTIREGIIVWHQADILTNA